MKPKAFFFAYNRMIEQNMPEKPLTIMIPELDTDGSCNTQCPLYSDDSDYGTACGGGFGRRKDYEGTLFAKTGCPQFEESTT
jgi:hypothetical protein